MGFDGESNIVQRAIRSRGQEAQGHHLYSTYLSRLSDSEESLRSAGYRVCGKDVTVDEKAMEELKRLADRFATPTIVIDSQVLLGFGINMAHIIELFKG